MPRRNIKKNIYIYIIIKEQEEIVNVDDDESNLNKEINLQNDEHDDNIDLDGVD